MMLWDRLSSRAWSPEASGSDSPLLFGRWLIAASFGDQNGETGVVWPEVSCKENGLHSNGFPARDGEALVPDRADRWRLNLNDVRFAQERFAPDPLPGLSDQAAILQLGRLLEKPDEGGWLEWCDTSPLAPGLDETLEQHPLEARIEAELSHLQAVCRRPRTHIRVDTEQLLVSRARRIARGAPAFLAAHPEDWSHRRLSGVHPRRVLAHVRRERWDLYENRLAARLVDNLVHWVKGRIAEVRRIVDQVLDRLNANGEDTNRHRFERVCRIWGEAYEARGRKEIADATLKRLERLLYRLLGLMDTALYRNVPRRAQVPPALRMTNLLANDDHYRGVSRLWLDWTRLGQPRPMTTKQRQARNLELYRSYNAWCMLLLVRACDQLGLEPLDEDLDVPFRPGCLIRLKDGRTTDQIHTCAWALKWEADGTIRLLQGPREENTCTPEVAVASRAGNAGRDCREHPGGATEAVLHIVPLIHALEYAGDRARMTSRAATLFRAVAEKPFWTVILHPGVQGAPESSPLEGIGNPPRPGTRGALDFIRVSPFSLDSVERVARALRWAFLVPEMFRYPPPIGPVPEALAGVAWLKRCDGASASYDMVRLPTPKEQREFELDEKLGQAREARDRFEARRDQLEQALREARGDRRRTADLNRERRVLLPKYRDAEKWLSRLSNLKRNFDEACTALESLSACPCCGQRGQLEPRNDGCFYVSCPSESCAAVWELRPPPKAPAPPARRMSRKNPSSNSSQDSATREEGRYVTKSASTSLSMPDSRIPILMPGHVRPERWRVSGHPGWVDHVLGCDVLSIPLIDHLDKDGVRLRFLPPRSSAHDIG